jgi:integral membrane protein
MPSQPNPATTTAPARAGTALTARAFRLVAIAEAASWLLLIVATIVKYSADAPQGVHVLGPIHGALFVAYVLLALVVAYQLRWKAWTLLVVLAESILPGGGFLAARRPELNPPPAR